MKTILTIILSILLIISLGLTAAGCEGEAPAATAGISDITMAKGVDAAKKPVNPTSRFTTDTPEVFCSAKMNNAPPGTKVTGKWIYVSGELAEASGYEIDSATLEIQGTSYFSMSLSRPTNGWPKGIYAVVLLIDGEEAGSAPFTVA